MGWEDRGTQTSAVPTTGNISLGAGTPAKVSGNGSGRTGLTIFASPANSEAVAIGYESATLASDGFTLFPGYWVTVGAQIQVWALAGASGQELSFEDE